MTWDPPFFDGGSPVTSYIVTASGTNSPAPIQTSDTTVVVSGLTNLKPYTFTGQATNALGTSLASFSSLPVIPAPVTTVPDPPTNVGAFAGDALARVTWKRPVFPGGSLISSYTVTSDPDGLTARTSNVALLNAVIVSGLTNNTAYTFTVTAANDSGRSTPSTTSDSITPSAESILPPVGPVGGGSGGGGPAPLRPPSWS